MSFYALKDGMTEEDWKDFEGVEPPAMPAPSTRTGQRLRAKGLLPAYETTTAKTQKKECPICHVEFEGSKDRRYCSDKCREEGLRRRDRARKAAKAYQNELSGSAGSWGLETDPWATGQLPAEIQRNALWA